MGASGSASRRLPLVGVGSDRRRRSKSDRPWPEDAGPCARAPATYASPLGANTDRPGTDRYRVALRRAYRKPQHGGRARTQDRPSLPKATFLARVSSVLYWPSCYALPHDAGAHRPRRLPRAWGRSSVTLGWPDCPAEVASSGLRMGAERKATAPTIVGQNNASLASSQQLDAAATAAHRVGPGST